MSWKIIETKEKRLFISVLESITLQSGTLILTKQDVYMHENISVMNEGGVWIFITDPLELKAGCIFFSIKANKL